SDKCGKPIEPMFEAAIELIGVQCAEGVLGKVFDRNTARQRLAYLFVVVDRNAGQSAVGNKPDPFLWMLYPKIRHHALRPNPANIRYCKCIPGNPTNGSNLLNRP